MHRIPGPFCILINFVANEVNTLIRVIDEEQTVLGGGSKSCLALRASLHIVLNLDMTGFEVFVVDVVLYFLRELEESERHDFTR